jgi:Domain of unknown function (DUF4326)
MLPYVVKVNQKRSNFTVYIGRVMPGLLVSKWYNPFHLWQCDSRAHCLRLYEEYIRRTPELVQDIPQLSDQALGCWCYPESCHGDVLVKIYKEVCKPGIGDMAQAVNTHGDLMLPEPLMIEYISTPFTEEWVKLSGQLGLVPRKQVVWP